MKVTIHRNSIRILIKVKLRMYHIPDIFAQFFFNNFLLFFEIYRMSFCVVLNN